MMRGMRRAMVITAGSTAGMMAVRVVARAMRAVNVARIMPVTAIPFFVAYIGIDKLCQLIQLFKITVYILNLFVVSVS